jgi:hypothetical protein
MNETVDTALGVYDAAGVDVFSQQMGGVPGRGGLLRGEVAGLGGSYFEEAVPVGAAGGNRRHAQKVTSGYVLCNADKENRTIGNSWFRFVRVLESAGGSDGGGLYYNEVFVLHYRHISCTKAS